MFHQLIPNMFYLIEYKNGQEEVVHQGTFVRYVDSHCAVFKDVACIHNTLGQLWFEDIFYFYSTIPRIYTPLA
jgi:hypothetical protein